MKQTASTFLRMKFPAKNTAKISARFIAIHNPDTNPLGGDVGSVFLTLKKPLHFLELEKLWRALEFVGSILLKFQRKKNKGKDKGRNKGSERKQFLTKRRERHAGSEATLNLT